MRQTRGHRRASILCMPGTFSRDDVERVAQLARLELTADEKDLFPRQLSDILAYAEQVGAVDTAGVAPTSHALASARSMRWTRLYEIGSFGSYTITNSSPPMRATESAPRTIVTSRRAVSRSTRSPTS